MAERRMFSKNVIESDPFMDMPAEAQMLYIHLNMASDDDGFCDNPRAIMRQCGASNDSMKLLIAKKFVLTFDKNDGFVAVIKHWRINNYIRKDNYRETKYKEFMRELYYDENRSYSMNPNDGHKPCLPPSPPPSPPEPYTTSIQPVDEPYTGRTRAVDNPLTQDRKGKSKDRVGKESTGKDSTGEERINSLSKVAGGKGESEGENRTPASFPQSGPAREKRIKELRDAVRRFTNLNFDAGSVYRLAEAEGITREELDAEEERTDQHGDGNGTLPGVQTEN